MFRVIPSTCRGVARLCRFHSEAEKESCVRPLHQHEVYIAGAHGGTPLQFNDCMRRRRKCSVYFRVIRAYVSSDTLSIKALIMVIT